MPSTDVPVRMTSTDSIWTSTTNMEPILPTPIAPKLGTMSTSTTISGKRRIMYPDEISPHALDRLGVNYDIVKKEKGMKKLGICDSDLIESEELRKYTGVSQIQPTSKVELMFGFNDEQLQRERAIKRLGTSEQEITEDYRRRIARLGMPLVHLT